MCRIQIKQFFVVLFFVLALAAPGLAQSSGRQPPDACERNRSETGAGRLVDFELLERAEKRAEALRTQLFDLQMQEGRVRAMDKQQLLNQLDKAWAAIKESYAGLSDAQMTDPGVTGNWSVKEILAHVTTWEEEALKYLPIINKGEMPPRYSVLYGGINSFNAQMTEQKRGLSLSEVLKQMDETHRRLIDYIRRAPEEEFTRETRFRRRLRVDTYSHYPKHARAIREWRERSAQ